MRLISRWWCRFAGDAVAVEERAARGAAFDDVLHHFAVTMQALRGSMTRALAGDKGLHLGFEVRRVVILSMT